MSQKYPVVAITGSSGSGTSTVRDSFQHIFTRDSINANIIEGDAFHKYERDEMDELIKKNFKNCNVNFSHFSPDANLLGELADNFKVFGETGTYKTRRYIHTEEQARIFHHVTVQLLVMSLRAIYDIQPPVTFLTKRVKKPDEDD